MEGLTVSSETKGGVTVLRCKGFIDSETSKEIEGALSGAIDAKNFKIIVDLDKIDYVSRAGWGIFVGQVQELRKNKGDIKFACMKREVREIFELLDFTNILEYYGDIESAVRAFKK